MYLEHSIVWLRDLDTKKIGVEVFEVLGNEVLDENGKDKFTTRKKFLNVYERRGPFFLETVNVLGIF